MRKIKLKACAFLLIAAIALMPLGGFVFNRKAEAATPGSITVGVGSGTKIAATIINPVTITEQASSNLPVGLNVVFKTIAATDVVIYTGDYGFLYTQARAGAVEYTISLTDGSHKIIAKNSSGQNKIPVPGYVLSVPSTNSTVFSVGDVLTYTDGNTSANKLYFPSSSVDNITKGTRVTLQYKNVTTRTNPGIIYYDSNFGAHTKQNNWGTEMSVDLNLDSLSPDYAKFYVKAFRPWDTIINGSDKNGLEIPKYGFTLSAYNTVTGGAQPYRASLLENVAFSLNDKIELSGFDFVGLESNVSITYDYADPTTSSNTAGAGFPENRGTNQLNIYTKSAIDGGKQLKTNYYGFEAAVDSNNIVIRTATNVLDIPDGGFVVSGHADKADWIRNNLKPGTTVTYNAGSKLLTASTSLRSHLEALVTAKTSMEAVVSRAKTRLYDVDIEAMEEILDEFVKVTAEAVEIDEELETITDEGQMLLKKLRFKEIIQTASDYKELIEMHSIESRVLDGRAVWHRPNVYNLEKNLAEMQANLDMLQDCGINSVFVETLWNGFSTGKSDYFEYHPDLAKYTYGSYDDFLTAYIAEAKLRGIEVHAWVEVFFMGTNANAGIIKNHQNWAMLNKDGAIYQPLEVSGTEHYIWLDPTNPEVRQYLLDYFEELLVNFPDLAGLNLDYIRYPTSSTPSKTNHVRAVDTNYTESAIKGFLAEKGMTIGGMDNFSLLKSNFINLVDGDKDLYNEWFDYRTNSITTMVKAIREMVLEVSPKTVISTATAPDMTDALDTKMQDWVSWVRNGWIDLCTPMAYYYSYDAVRTNTETLLVIIDGKSYSYVGLGPFMGWQEIDYVMQINASHLANATGYNLFSTAELLTSAEAREILKKTVNRVPAIVATSAVDIVLDTVFDNMLDKADRLYVENTKMTAAQRTAYETELERIKLLPYETSRNLWDLLTELKSLRSKASSYASGYAVERIQEDLDILIDNIDIKLSRLMILNGEWNPETETVRPSLDVDPGPGDKDKDKEPGKTTGCKKGQVMPVMAVLLAAAFVIKGKRILGS